MDKPRLKYLIIAVFVIGSVQLVQAQKTDPQLLEKLITTTSSVHPFRQGLPDWIKPEPPEPEKVAGKFDPALASDTRLTADQKSFVKANYAKLATMVNEKMLVAMGRHVRFSDWLTAYLTEVYPRQLTAAEMKEWIAYFETRDGKETVKAIFALPQPTDAASQALLQKFENAPIGIKFIKIFGDDLNTVIQAKMTEVEPKVKEELDAVLSPPELQKLFHQFVAENYKR